MTVREAQRRAEAITEDVPRLPSLPVRQENTTGRGAWSNKEPSRPPRLMEAALPSASGEMRWKVGEGRAWWGAGPRVCSGGAAGASGRGGAGVEKAP